MRSAGEAPHPSCRCGLQAAASAAKAKEEAEAALKTVKEEAEATLKTTTDELNKQIDELKAAVDFDKMDEEGLKGVVEKLVKPLKKIGLEIKEIVK